MTPEQVRLGQKAAIEQAIGLPFDPEALFGFMVDLTRGQAAAVRQPLLRVVKEEEQ